jgi:D-inositol-3-phosphate glycosyltransferase
MNDPLRIALIGEHASSLATRGDAHAGGQNICVTQVARHLARAGHQVDVLARRDDPAPHPVVDLCRNLRVLHVDADPATFVPKEQLPRHMPAFTRATHRMLRHSVPYDVVHANCFMSGMVAQRLKHAMALPFVVSFHARDLARRRHQQDTDAFPPAAVDIERALMRSADTVIAECPQDREDLIHRYGARPSKLLTVPCGYDPEAFSPMNRALARQKLGLDPKEFIVLLGALVPSRGIDPVIHALAHLPAGVPARLLVVGGEARDADAQHLPEIARLRRLARDAGVADRLTITGQRRRDELRCHGAAADVFVTTPWCEPLGITPLEAMACGTPVIGSAVGGAPCPVEDGITGFLLPPHDPKALGEKLMQLQANPFLAESMGRAGARRARALFSWAHVANELAQVYRATHQRRLMDWAAPLRGGLRLVSSRGASVAPAI